MSKLITFPHAIRSRDQRSEKGDSHGEGKTLGNRFSDGFVPKAQVIDNFKRLYPMPHVMMKARRIIADPKTDFRQLATVLQTDPALAARVVKIANSAYYKRSGSISSVLQATTLLGMRIVTQIITLVSQSRMLGQALYGYGMEAGALWRHSLRVAIMAELLAHRTGRIDASEAFLAGLMHDAGKIILDSYLVERNGTDNRPSPLVGLEVVDMETRTLGFDHADIGCELCMKWQLPSILASAIRFHHMPQISGDNKLAHILNLSDFVVHLQAGPNEASGSWDEAESALSRLQLTPEYVREVAAVAEDRLETFEEDTY